MIYIQHSYNREVYTSTMKSPFEKKNRYFPPSPLDVICGQQGGVMEDIAREVLKVEKNVEKIRQIHLQVHETLDKPSKKYKA
jgi:hypothetical protein